MDTFFTNPAFWVGVSFFLFVALIARPVGKALAAALDSRSVRIETELDEAVRLREEAQAVLSAYQKKQRECLAEAENILIAAKADAERMASEAERSLQEALEKRKRLSLEKIAQAESKALQELQDHAVDIAVAAARTLLEQYLSKDDSSDEIIALATKDLERKIH